MITQARLKSLFLYDEETGDLIWRYRPDAARKWNSRLAGKVAGYLEVGEYRHIRIDGKLYKAHRLIWLYAHGEWPVSEIDHINGVRGDNRIENLREATRVENSRNTKRRSTNTSGVQGVLWHPVAKKWMSYIMVDGKQKYLGLYTNLDAAKQRRADAESQFSFHENHGRVA